MSVHSLPVLAKRLASMALCQHRSDPCVWIRQPKSHSAVSVSGPATHGSTTATKELSYLRLHVGVQRLVVDRVSGLERHETYRERYR
jgi:hypothetical protein